MLAVSATSSRRGQLAPATASYTGFFSVILEKVSLAYTIAMQILLSTFCGIRNQVQYSMSHARFQPIFISTSLLICPEGLRSSYKNALLWLVMALLCIISAVIWLQSSKLKFDALGQHHFSTRVSFLMQIFDPVDLRLKIMPISWAVPCDHFSLKICDRYTTKGSPARQLATNHKYLCHDHCWYP